MKINRLFIYIAVIFAAAALMSCYGRHDEDDHEHESVQYATYSDDYELFVEVEPMIVGEPCRVIAHITDLSDYKPVAPVPVAIRLAVGGRQASLRLDQPHEQGVYMFEITPPAQGCGEFCFVIGADSSAAAMTIDDVEVFASHEEYHRHEHEHGHGESTSGFITFTKEQSWKIGFGTELLSPAPMGEVIKTSAQVLSAQGDSYQIVAKSSGIVSLVGDAFVEGSAVKVGQVLGSVESSSLADNNMAVRLQQATADYDEAKAAYERSQTLAQDKIVSMTELGRSKARYESAKALYDNLRQNFSNRGASFSSPVNGFITSVMVSNGTYVEAGQPLATVSRNRDLYIKAQVSPRHYDALARITAANISTDNGRTAIPIKELDGSLVSFGKTTNDHDPMIPVTFRVRNTANLAVGTFVTLYIVSQSPSEVISVPNDAVVEEMGDYFVFVQHTPESFEKRMVSCGATDGIRTAVFSGLRAGERVVTKGASTLKLSQSSAALDPHAGHVHSH